MPEKLKRNAYDPDFLTPMNAQKPGPQVGPEVANLPPQDIPDPLGLVPGGGKGRGISGGASKPLPKS